MTTQASVAPAANANASNGSIPVSAATDPKASAQDAFVTRAQENAEAKRFTTEVATVKLYEAVLFLTRAGLDRPDALELAKSAIEAELSVMRMQFEAAIAGAGPSEDS